MHQPTYQDKGAGARWGLKWSPPPPPALATRSGLVLAFRGQSRGTVGVVDRTLNQPRLTYLLVGQ